MVIGIDSSRAFVGDKTGTENYSYHLIKEMLRLPESCSHTFVLFIRPNAVLPKELAGYSNVIVKEVKFNYLWTQVGLAWETWQKVKSDKGKVILDVLWVPAHTLPILRRGFGGRGCNKLKTVVTIHGLEYQWLPEYKNLLQKWYLPLSTFYAAKNADKLIAVSGFTAKQLIKELHTDKNKIEVIHEGTASSRAQSRDLDSSTSVGMTTTSYALHDKKYILFVGTVQPRKNLVALVEAFSQFSKKYSDYKLVIAGGIGWMAREILSAPNRYDVQEKVVFTGRVSDSQLHALYLGASVYVQPSITEGFGLPILEAMNMGVPVISSDGGALPEVVGDAGIIVKISNPKFSNSQIKNSFEVRLAAAMEKMVGDSKFRTKMISLGKERVSEFTWEKAASKTLKVILLEGGTLDTKV